MPSARADFHWTTTNLGEAAPGVLTPLGLGLWGEPAERAARLAIHTLGVMRADELAAPADVGEWILRPFYGRLAMRLEFMATVGDRMPGVSGEDAIRGMFGAAPETMTFSPTRSRYGAIAVRFPRAFAGLPGRVGALAADQDAWWRASVARVDGGAGLDAGQARALFAEAQRRFVVASSLQLVATMSTIQPLYDAVGAIVARTGAGDVAVLSGAGGAEMAVVRDIWRASREQLSVADVVRAHGFHGPLEGEISGRVWREDDAPLRAMMARYAGRDDPRAHEAERAHARAAMQREVLAGLPTAMRPPASLALRLAAARIPLRGVAKRSFLQAIDVARAAAGRVGRLEFDDPSDVFMLTGPELLLGQPVDTAARREQRAAHMAVRLATAEWQGLPALVPADDGPTDGVDTVSGLGVSPGVVEGVVRVVDDPSFDDVEDDEILVAPTTDPSWASIMFVSAALVVDVGGALSHAAVVARELGIPCVVGTRDGTRILRTGDRVRVDGAAGTVEILSR